MSDIIKLNSIVEADLVEVNGIAIANVMYINGRDIFWQNFSGDDFNGLDGAPVNVRIWTSPITEGTLVVNDNKIRGSVGSGQENRIESNFRLTGNFDHEVDFSLITYPSSTSWALYFVVVSELASAVRIETRIDFHSSFHATNRRYMSKAYDGGSSFGYVGEVTTDTFGTIRVKRIGNIFTTYYWDGTWNFMANHTLTNATGADFFVRLQWVSTSPDIVIDLPDYQINSGTVIQP